LCGNSLDNDFGALRDLVIISKLERAAGIAEGEFRGAVGEAILLYDPLLQFSSCNEMPIEEDLHMFQESDQGHAQGKERRRTSSQDISTRNKNALAHVLIYSL
jgi:hypothetical protein